MADKVYIKITDLKDGPIVGASTVTSDGREGMIECFSFEDGVHNPINPHTGAATGQRALHPMKLRTPLGRHSVLLAKACAENHKLNVDIHFYRPCVHGTSGRVHNFMSVGIQSALVQSITRVVPDSEVLGTDEGRVPYEILEFVYKDSKWEFKPEDAMDGDSCEHEDKWAER